MHALFGAEVQWKSQRIGRLELPHEALEQPNRVGAESAGNRQKFNDVKAPLASLVFRDKRLRSFEPLGDLLLGKAGAFARFDHQPAKSRLLGSMD
jgi:hypothetical protein